MRKFDIGGILFVFRFLPCRYNNCRALLALLTLALSFTTTPWMQRYGDRGGGDREGGFERRGPPPSRADEDSQVSQ
jgi:hypothetical protein